MPEHNDGATFALCLFLFLIYIDEVHWVDMERRKTGPTGQISKRLPYIGEDDRGAIDMRHFFKVLFLRQFVEMKQSRSSDVKYEGLGLLV